MNKATDEAHDAKVFELGQAYVRAHNEWRAAIANHGPLSKEVADKWHTLTTIQNRLHRLQAQDRKRTRKRLGVDADRTYGS